MERSTTPRVPPGTRADIGTVNWVIATVGGRVAGVKGPVRLFATLGRHKRLFRAWMRFAGRLMPGGKLPRVDTELVILRVSHNCDCPYEANHHNAMAVKAGLSKDQVAAVPEGAQAPVFSPRQQAILAAVDELHADRRIGDATWERLRAAGFSDRDLIELCLLAGHYAMLAGTINSLGIQPEPHR